MTAEIIKFIDLASFFVFLLVAFKAFEKYLNARKFTNMWLVAVFSFLFFSAASFVDFAAALYQNQFIASLKDTFIVAASAFLLAFLLIYRKSASLVDGLKSKKKSEQTPEKRFARAFEIPKKR